VGWIFFRKWVLVTFSGWLLGFVVLLVVSITGEMMHAKESWFLMCVA